MKTNQKFIPISLLLLILVFLIQVVGREFQNQNGKTLKAEVVSVDGDSATLRLANGRKFSAPISIFVNEDQAYLHAWSLVSFEHLLSIPKEWDVMTAATISKINDVLRGSNAPLRFTFGAHLKGQEALDYPHLLGFVTDRTLFNEEELKAMKPADIAKLESEIKDGASSNENTKFKGILTNIDAGTPTLGEGEIVWTRTASVRVGVGPITTLTAAKIVDGGSVEYHGICLRDNEQTFISTFKQIVTQSTVRERPGETPKKEADGIGDEREKPGETASTKKFESKEHRFSIHFPKKWAVEERNVGTAGHPIDSVGFYPKANLRAGDRISLALGVVVDEAPAGQRINHNPEAVFAGKEREVQEALGFFADITTGTKTLPSGEWHFFVATGELEGQSYRRTIYFQFKGNTYYEVTIHGYESEISGFGSLLEKCVKSFRYNRG